MIMIFRELSCPENRLKMQNLSQYSEKAFTFIGNPEMLFDFLVSEQKCLQILCIYE